jgi:hypothetical protein
MMCGDCPLMDPAHMPADWKPRAVCCTAETHHIDERAIERPAMTNWERANEIAEERRRRVGPGNRHDRRKKAARARR